MTAAGNCVKVWDGRTGFIIHEHVVTEKNDDVTAMCIDWSEQKLIVGTAKGYLSLYTVNNMEVSERSERALVRTRILAMNPAKWLQT